MQRPIITHISGFVAGRKIDQKLGTKNLIVAPNHAGKTTLLNCARLAHLGYLPELGKLNEATFDLAYLDRLEANVALSDGRALSRSWHKSAKGIEQRKTLPADFSADIPLLNHKEYFGLSASEQIDYVFSRVQMPDEYAYGTAIEEVAKITEESEDVTSDDEDAVEHVVSLFKEEYKAAGSLNAALIAMTKDKGRLATEYTKYNRSQRDSEGAARTAIELQAKSGAVDEENVKGLEGQVQTLQKQLADKSQALGVLQQKHEQAQEYAERIDELTRALKNPVPDFKGSIQMYTEARAKLEERLKPYDKEEHEKLIAKKEKLQAEIESLSVNSLNLERTVKELEEERTGLAEACACKTCLSDAPGWKTRRLEKLESELTQSRLENSGIDAKLLKKQSEVEKVEQQCVKMGVVFHEEIEIESQIRAVEARITEVKREMADDAKDRADWSAELARLKGSSTAPEDGQAIEELQAEIDKVNAALGELRTKVRDAHALKEQIRLAEHAIAKHQRDKSFAVVIQKARKNLIALQGEMVAQVFGPIVETGNKILGDLLPTPLAFNEPHLGRWQGEHFVKHKTFSGMETEICYAAIASALSADSSMKVLMMDELGTLTASVQAKVLSRLSDAVDRGDLDQIVCAIPRDSSIPARDGWNLIEL